MNVLGRRVGFTLVMAVSMAGCSVMPAANEGGAEPPDYVNVMRHTDTLIQLVPRGDDAALANDHPAAFDAEQLQALLMSVRIESEDEGVVTLASPERLLEISDGLAKALARAEPSQDVFLVFFRRKARGLLFSSQRHVTSARAFFRDDKLNLIFDELDNFYSSFRDPQIKPLKPGSRDRERDVDGQRLVEADAWQWHDGRRDWVELAATASAIEAAVAALPSLTSLGEGQSAKTLTFGPAAEKQAPDTPPAASSQPVAPDTPAAATATKATPAAAVQADRVPDEEGEAVGAASWSRIETRLKQLKRLREQGLISEQDYEDKKAELLEELP